MGGLVFFSKPIFSLTKYHFDILAKGKTDYHCKMIKDLIYSRTWASFQRQRRKWKGDALLICSVFLLLSIC